MKSISIVIPCYNCENFILNNIKKILKKLKFFNHKFEIILVNDGSSDFTLNKLKQSLKLNNKIKVVTYNKNIGKSFAIKKGIKKSKYNHIIITDSNLPYFEVFTTIIEKLKQNYDLVFVNRRNKKSFLKKKILSVYQILRFLIGYLVSIIIRVKLRMNIDGGDTQAGLKGFKKIRNFGKINFISKIFFFDLELMYFYYILNKKIFSVPVKYEIPNSSSIKIFSVKRNFKIFLELFTVISKLKKLKII